jgi:hypothetical protein
MQTVTDHLEDLVVKAAELADTKISIWKLKAADKVSNSVSSLITFIILLLLIALAVIVISFGLAIYLGHQFGNTSYGFFAVGGFYALAGLIIYFARGSLIGKPVRNHVTAIFQKEK